MDNIEIQRNSWFETDIFSFFMDEKYCDQINDIVEKEKSSWKKGLQNVKAKTSGWNGLRFPVIQEISNFLTKKILPSIGEAKNFQRNNWETMEAWINYYQKGDSTEPHHHFFSAYCAILITKTNESKLKFINPLEMHGYYKSFYDKKRDEKINEKKGLCILFPSYAFHAVEQCSDDRISVAFNFDNMI